MNKKRLCIQLRIKPIVYIKYFANQESLVVAAEEAASSQRSYAFQEVMLAVWPKQASV